MTIRDCGWSRSVKTSSDLNLVGEYLKSLRREHGLTTRHVGLKAGCTDATVSRIEQGKRKPSLQLLWRLVEALDGDYTYALSLLARDGGVPEAICATISSGSPSSAQRAARA
ncbi:MAG: hypothetical protein DRN21_06040 [Thermoplasmata archaeon]|nr:MAG: hypothetical protein DRN21_06040 [Thermoplasmata archaeon]